MVGWRLIRLLPTPVSAVTRDTWSSDAAIHSELLGREMAVEVFEPSPGGCVTAAMLVLLHGRGGDQRQWMEGVAGDGVGIDVVAHRLIDDGVIPPLLIASADIDDSYGVDSQPANDGYEHGPYEAFIVDELVPQLQAAHGHELPVFVGGLSMGGFAALNAAFRHPDAFVGAAALSPAFFVDPPADRSWIYTEDKRQSLFELAASGSADGKRIFLGYGDNDYDWIRGATAQLSAQLVERGEANAATVVSGQHEMATWRALAEPMLRALFPTGPQAATTNPC